MICVVTEKPSAARNFATALGGRSGTYRGESYEIVSLRGHVIELVREPAEQVSKDKFKRYHSWELDALPWDPADLSFDRRPKDGCFDVLKALKSVLGRVDEVAIATDVDPSGEGELLAWEALDWCRWSGKTTRVRFSDETPKSICKAFSSREPISSMESDGDYVKAWCRSRWDYLSMQWTRVATTVARTHGIRMLVREGRLKSVITSLVGDQEVAWTNYEKHPYFETRYKDDHGVTYAVDAEAAVRVVKAEDLAPASPCVATPIEDSRQKRHATPPKLPDLAQLSATLAPKGISPKQVLSTYQAMYEAHIVSYPRTEDAFVSPEQFNELLPLTERIAALVGVDARLLTHREPRSTHVKAGGAHGANRPGSTVPSTLSELGKFGKGAQEIYTTLARAWLAMLAEDEEFEVIKGHLQELPEFKGSCRHVLSGGWTLVMEREREEEQEQEESTAASLGSRAESFVFEGANKRPQRPTVKWLKKKLERYAVGTGATRTSTVAEICEGKWALMNEKKGVLSLTDCGRVSHVLLANCNIASPDVTADLFRAMEEVGRFEQGSDDVLASVAPLVVSDMEQMKANAEKLKSLGVATGAESIGCCPVCGKDVLLAQSGKAFWCISMAPKKAADGTWETPKEGCGFKAFAVVAGKKLTQAQIQTLLQGKPISLKGLKSRAGKTFNATGKLARREDDTWGISLEFSNQKKPGGRR